MPNCLLPFTGTSSAGARARSASIATILLVGSAAIGACSGEEEADVALTAPPQPATIETPQPDPSIWETVQTDPQLEAGRLVWVGTCLPCHSTGLGGAPFIGNRTLWSPRLAKGLDTLVAHATEGFYGDVGEMPARGGNASLSDEEIRAAVRFMASRAGEIKD